MITKLYIENFRSIEKAEVDLGKITVLTGANNSGKSSVIYALLALRNVVTKPNQNVDNFFNLSFINLGGLKNVYSNSSFLNDKVKIGVQIETKYIPHTYQSGKSEFHVALGESNSYFKIKVVSPFSFTKKLDVSFPYPANKESRFSFKDVYTDNLIALKDETIVWTGLHFNSLNILEENSLESQLLRFIFNYPIYSLEDIDFVPIRRGFTQPYYSPVPLSSSRVSTEEEIATIISLDKDLIHKIAFYLEKIVDRHFSIYTTPGTAIFYLQTRHKETGFTTDLVNEGLGTNQLVTLLAKVLQKNNKFICIDEPEIHLHPSVISKLVGVLVEIAEKEGKQFLISTHSEHFITALLKHTHQKDISHEDVKVYYLKKEGQKTVFEHQAINEKGQIEGGLVHFYETELEDLSSLFKLTD